MRAKKSELLARGSPLCPSRRTMRRRASLCPVARRGGTSGNIVGHLGQLSHAGFSGCAGLPAGGAALAPIGAARLPAA